MAKTVHAEGISVWAVFFMKKSIRRIGLCLLVVIFFWCGTMISDRQRLSNELIRLHVVANSNSQTDQSMKLFVRDAVTESLKHDLMDVGDVEQAMQYIREKLPYIQSVAEAALESIGYDMPVSVSLCREAFNTRFYDTFTLPAGIYHSLRIVIGEGQGKNWWCVIFPDFCIPASGEGFETVAVGAGFPKELGGALSGEEYELRFGILDVMGKLENMFFAG